MSNLQALAAIISQNANVLATELSAGGQPDPSWDAEAPLDFPPLGREGADARMALISAATEIIRLATGPTESLRNFYTTCLEVGAVRTLVNLEVPHKIPLNGVVPYDVIARNVGLDADILARLCRYAIVCGFLTEPEPGHVGHNACSAIFLRDAESAHGFEWNFNVAYNSASKMYEAFELDHTGLEPSKCPLSVAHKEEDGPYEDMWEYYNRVPEDGQRFHSMMNSLTRLVVWSADHAVKGYDWDKLPKGASVVDGGGATGKICMALADKYPDLKYYIQERQELLEDFREQLPEKYEGTITWEARDFQDPQYRVADVYFFRFIFHDQSDKYAQRLLQNLIPGMRHGAKLIIMDASMPPFGKAPLAVERTLRTLDIMMYAFCAGKQRSLQEFILLVGSVDPRLRFESLRRPEGSALSMMEWAFHDPDFTNGKP